MVSGILINMAFLISYVSVGAQILRSYESRHSVRKRRPLSFQLLFGAYTGCMGITLMLFAVHSSADTLMDFRYLAVITAAVFGGPIPLALCTAVLFLYRLFCRGFGLSAFYAALPLLLSAAAAGLVCRTKLSEVKKWTVSMLLSILCGWIGFILLIPGPELKHVLAVFSVCMLLISVFCYLYIRSMLEANALFRKLRLESTKDYLTGLNNVRRFDELYNSTIHTAQGQEQNLSLLMLDIDFFKKVNDLYGHQNGDAILVQLSRILERSGGGTVSRNGGEEFTVLLRSCDETQAIAAAERLRIAVENSDFILVDGSVIHITVSVGVASYPGSAQEPDRLLEKADMALYMAKRGGRNKVVSACCAADGCGADADSPPANAAPRSDSKKMMD